MLHGAPDDFQRNILLRQHVAAICHGVTFKLLQHVPETKCCVKNRPTRHESSLKIMRVKFPLVWRTGKLSFANFATPSHFLTSSPFFPKDDNILNFEMSYLFLNAVQYQIFKLHVGHASIISPLSELTYAHLCTNDISTPKSCITL